MDNQPMPQVIERFADNGEHSHYVLIDDEGRTLWSEDPDDKVNTPTPTASDKSGAGEDLLEQILKDCQKNWVDNNGAHWEVNVKQAMTAYADQTHADLVRENERMREALTQIKDIAQNVQLFKDNELSRYGREWAKTISIIAEQALKGKG